MPDWSSFHIHAVVTHGPAILLIVLLGIPSGMNERTNMMIRIFTTLYLVSLILSIITGQRALGDRESVPKIAEWHEQSATILTFLSAGYGLWTLRQPENRLHFLFRLILLAFYLWVMILGVTTAHP